MRLPAFSSEFRLLIDCSTWGPASSTALPAPDDIDWAAFVELVRRHRIAPLVCRNLLQRGAPAAPPAVFEHLRAQARRASVRALRHAAAALEIGKLFAGEGIDVLALKGAVLSQRLFHDAGMRDVRDVDLLVRQDALSAADALLRQNGFERHFPRTEPTPRMAAALLEDQQHFEYRRARTGVAVELHWKIAGWAPANLAWLWRHSRCCPWAGGVLREPDDQALLLLLADHGAQHRWFCLKWLADAAALCAASPAPAIPECIAAARSLDLARPLAQMALLLERMYRTGSGNEWSELVAAEPMAPWLADEAVLALLGSEDEHFSARLRNRRYRRRLRARPLLRKTARLIQTRDFDQVRLPDALFWLYYFLRPVLWLRRLSRRRASASEFERTYFSGAALYGDDFDARRIGEWWAREEEAYCQISRRYPIFEYAHRASNIFHLYRFLEGRYRTCLAFGCGRGGDVAPLAPQVERFIAIEPAEAWWAERINGAEAHYRKPASSGDIGMDSGSADLVVCLSALHHIANAGHVLSEMVRVLRPGGLLLIREPISTMGDWRQPRPGRTLDERGFPPAWFDARAGALGLRAIRKTYCGFPGIKRLAKLLHLRPAYNHGALVRIDAWLCWMTRWNLHYHRDSFLKRIAPLEIAYVFAKAPGPPTA